MRYKNANAVLPDKLVAEIQTYVDGQLLYIPRKQETHFCWGSNTGTRNMLIARNQQICEEYRQGKTIPDLSKTYYLSEKSIWRIIRDNIPPRNRKEGGNTIE